MVLLVVLLVVVVRLFGGDVDPGDAGVCLCKLVDAAELVALEAGSPLELACAVHARVGLFAGMAAPVGFEVGEAGEVAAAAAEGAAVAFAARGFDDDGLGGGWGGGCAGRG